MFDSETLQRALVAGPIIVLSLTVHEFSHAWSALKFGDDTAARLGRLSFNPLVHLDPMGTLVMVLSNFTFGWAKPVPVNLAHVDKPRVADFWVSFAGPISNIIIAIILSLVFKIVSPVPGAYFYQALVYGVQINLVLALFNMIPLFPLDGSHMLRSVLPPETAVKLVAFERIAPMVLLGLIVLPNFIPGFPGIFTIIGPVLNPLINILL